MAVAELRNASARRFPWGEERREECLEHRVLDAEPARASMSTRNRFEVILPGRRLEWRAETELGSDAAHFEYRHLRILLENGVELRRRVWQDRVARDFQ